MTALLPSVTHPPDRLVSIFAEKQTAIFRNREADRPPPNVSLRRHEPGDEIFVIAPRLPGRFVEGHTHDLVTGPPLAVPGAVKGREEVAFVLRRELSAVIETKIERGRVALHEDVGHNNLAGQLRMLPVVPRVLVVAEIEPWPAVESARLHAANVVRHQILAQPVPLVRAHPKLARARAEGDPEGVTDSPGENVAPGAVRIELEDAGAIRFRR